MIYKKIKQTGFKVKQCNIYRTWIYITKFTLNYIYLKQTKQRIK